MVMYLGAEKAGIRLAGDGFTFLSDADAQAADSMPPAGTTLVGRPQSGLSNRVRAIAESWPELFAWKRELLPQMEKTPYIEGETPAVCAWYPSARAVLVWNLSEQRQDLTLRCGNAHRSVNVGGLDIALIEGIDA